MKKKGLIISTVVMVVVLIASLTTATYAWFTTSAKTTIDGFQLEVVSNSAVRIGLRQSITTSTDFQSTDGENLFINGDTSFTGAEGKLTGTWDNTSAIPGLGTEINHNIRFGDVKKAIGVTSKALTESLTSADAKGFKANGDYTGYDRTDSNIFAANGDGSAANTPLIDPKAAVINGNETTPGDLAYLWLGITPSGELEPDTNKLYIVVKSDGASVGLGAAVHVAFRLFNPEGSTTPTTSSDWQDKDIFEVNQAMPKASVVVNKADLPVAVWEMIAADTNMAVPTGAEKLEGAAVYAIDLTNYVIDKITQLEMVIYVDGADPDCINSAVKNVGVSIGMYFGAQLKQTTTGGGTDPTPIPGA